MYNMCNILTVPSVKSKIFQIKQEYSFIGKYPKIVYIAVNGIITIPIIKSANAFEAKQRSILFFDFSSIILTRTKRLTLTSNRIKTTNNNMSRLNLVSVCNLKIKHSTVNNMRSGVIEFCLILFDSIGTSKQCDQF